jgi:predicted nuclease of predicted toxin-antitoxin system
VKLLFDQNFSAKLCSMLDTVFSDLKHVKYHLGLHEASDVAIWEYALEYDFVIVTKDGDFRQLSTLKGAPPKVLWLNLGNCDTVFIAQLLLRNVAVISEFVSDTNTGLLVLTRDS